MMRRTLAVLAITILAGCTEMVTVPAEPEPQSVPDEAYTGIDAYRMVVADLKRELADPALLDFAGTMTGRTAEQRRRHVQELVAKFERHIAEYDIQGAMASSSGRCSKNPQLIGSAITFIERPPLFPGSRGLFTVRPFTSSSGGAILGNDLWVVHGRDWPIEGPPPVTGERQWSKSYKTTKCETAIYRPDIDFYPEFVPGYVWAHNIHRVINYFTNAEETDVTEAGPRFFDGDGIDPPVL